MIAKTLTSAVLVALWAGAASAGEPPPNRWVKLDEKKAGKRWGAAAVWLEGDKRLLVLGGEVKADKGQPAPADIRTFDPTSGAWADRSGRLSKKAHRYCFENGFAWDPTGRRILALLGSAVWANGSLKLVAYDVERDAAVELATRGSPFAGVSRPFVATGKRWLRGAATVFDPVRRELLLIGGHSGGADRGTLGVWACSIENRTWRRLTFGNPAADPLQQALRKAGQDEKGLIATARNLFFAGRPPREESAAVKRKLAPAQAAMVEELRRLSARIGKLAPTAGLHAPSLSVARRLVAESLTEAQRAAKGFSAGKLDAALIAAAEKAAWRLDEAACAAAVEPGPRYRPAVAYDPERKVFLLFGGDHGDYLMSDTWTYDPAGRVWRQHWPAVAPGPRAGASMVWLPRARRMALVAGETYLKKMVYQRFTRPLPGDVWTYDADRNTWALTVAPPRDGGPVPSSTVACVGDDTLVALSASGSEWRNYMVGSTWKVRVDASVAAGAPAKQGGVSGGVRLYRNLVNVYDPQWYDQAPRGDPNAVARWLAAIPANEWVTVPRAPRPAGESSWGTALYDPHRDQLYYWSGGHCADPSDAVHHYHPGLNRWSIGYVAGGIGKGTLFTGRPDCLNHTYKNYAYDPVSRTMVAPHLAGTHVYDPDRRDWTRFTPDQPFAYETYVTKCVSTPRGVVAWTGGRMEGAATKPFFGLFDVATMTWKALPVVGKLPRSVHGDENGMTWDSRRNVLYLHSARAYQKYDGQVYRYDVAAGAVAPLDPKNRRTIGDRCRPRESVYLPDLDMILFGTGFVGGKQAAYDVGGNRWVVLANVTKASRTVTWDADKRRWVLSEAKPHRHVGSVSFAPVLDTRRNVLWAPSDYKSLFVMRIDPTRLRVSETPE
jgi:hypothetical protein